MIKSQATNGRLAWRQMLKCEEKHGYHNADLKDFPRLLKRNLKINRKKVRCRLLWRLYRKEGTLWQVNARQ